MKEKIIVSACLLGDTCKYNGGHNFCEKVKTYIQDYEVIKICPEVMGGLETPRIPCERVGNKVFNENKEDKTYEFYKGANIALELAKEHNVRKAILKAKSPSCGKDYIYDGTFSKKIINGHGVCAQLFLENGIQILREDEIL